MISIEFADPILSHVFNQFDGTNMFLYPAANTADEGEPLHVLPIENFAGVPEYYLLHVLNVNSAALLATSEATQSNQAMSFSLVIDEGLLNEETIAINIGMEDGRAPEILLEQMQEAIDDALGNAEATQRIVVGRLNGRFGFWLIGGSKLRISFNSGDAIQQDLHFQNDQQIDLANPAAGAPVQPLGRYSLSFRAVESATTVGNTIDIAAGDVNFRTQSSFVDDVAVAIPLGDINNDGRADFIGAVSEDLGELDDLFELPATVHPADVLEPTLARIYFGAETLPTDPHIFDANTVTLSVPAPIQTHSLWGSQTEIVPIGDVNQDGIDDLAIVVSIVIAEGAPEFHHGGL